MFQAALRPQALKCSVARTLQASEEARVTAVAKLFPGRRVAEAPGVGGAAFSRTKYPVLLKPRRALDMDPGLLSIRRRTKIEAPALIASGFTGR